MIDKDYNINILDFGYSAEIRDENKEVKKIYRWKRNKRICLS